MTADGGLRHSGITFTGAYGEPNLEKVASLQPDLVVGYEFDEDSYAVLPLAPAQEADTGDDAISLEQLGARGADVVLVADHAGDGERDPGAQVLLDNPVYRRLAAVQAGQAHVVDGATTVGAAWARMDVFLDVREQRLLPARADVVAEG